MVLCCAEEWWVLLWLHSQNPIPLSSHHQLLPDPVMLFNYPQTPQEEVNKKSISHYQVIYQSFWGGVNWTVGFNWLSTHTSSRSFILSLPTYCHTHAIQHLGTVKTDSIYTVRRVRSTDFQPVARANVPFRGKVHVRQASTVPADCRTLQEK